MLSRKRLSASSISGCLWSLNKKSSTMLALQTEKRIGRYFQPAEAKRRATATAMSGRGMRLKWEDTRKPSCTCVERLYEEPAENGKKKKLQGPHQFPALRLSALYAANWLDWLSNSPTGNRTQSSYRIKLRYEAHFFTLHERITLWVLKLDWLRIAV